MEWSALNRELLSRGLVLAGGQGKLKGKIFRIGHLGDVSVDDIVSAIEVLEEGACRGRCHDRARRRRAGCPPCRRGRLGRRHGRPSPSLTMRVLVAEKLAAEGVELLRADHEVDVRVGLSREELLAALPEYDALLVRSGVKADAEAIAAGRRLLVIGRAGVGVDNIDIAAATAAGIIVVNAPTGNTVAAAEHTLALLFALARHVPAADASMRAGDWERSTFMGRELIDKTLGVIGLGKIGMAVAEPRPRPRHERRGPRPVRDERGGRPARHQGPAPRRDPAQSPTS